jgi:hypothetical protein
MWRLNASTRRQEERVVPASHREQRRPARAEVLLERRVERHVAPDASLLKTFASTVRPTSGALANSFRNWLIFSSAVASYPDPVAVVVSIVMSVIPFRFSRFRR